MNKKMKRFFVLKNFKELFLSDVFTADSEKPAESDVVAEAESIINEYFRKMGYADRTESKKKRKSTILCVGIAALIAIVIFVAVRFI